MLLTGDYLSAYTYFQWTEDGKVFQIRYLTLDKVRLLNKKLKRFRKNVKKQAIILSIAAGNYDTEIIIDLIKLIQDFRVKYQESSIGSENFAYLQSIENKCKRSQASEVQKIFLYYKQKQKISVFTD